MSAGTFDLYIEQGATFQQDIYWKNDATPPTAINVFGYTGKVQIRSAIGSTTVLFTFMTTPHPPMIGADPNTTTPDGTILLGTTDGKITLSATAAATLAIAWTTGVYDLVMVSPTGIATRLLQGTVTVGQGVTDI